jgi:hypothetical protein
MDSYTVQYRVTECGNQIEELEQRMSVSIPKIERIGESYSSMLGVTYAVSRIVGFLFHIQNMLICIYMVSILRIRRVCTSVCCLANADLCCLNRHKSFIFVSRPKWSDITGTLCRIPFRR